VSKPVHLPSILPSKLGCLREPPPKCLLAPAARAVVPKDLGRCQTETRTLNRHQQAGTEPSFGSAPPTSSKLKMVQNLPSDPTQLYLKSSKQLQVSRRANSVPIAEAGAPIGIQQWRRLSRVSSTADSSHQPKLTGCLSRSQVVLQSFSSAVSALFGLYRLTFSLGRSPK